MLTGHIMFQQAGLIALRCLFSATPCGRPLSARRFCFALLGHYLQHDVQADSGSDDGCGFSIGHQQQFASWIAYKLRRSSAKKRKALKTSNCQAAEYFPRQHRLHGDCHDHLLWAILLSFGIDTVQAMAGKVH